MPQPRRYTREQIQFILEKIGRIKNADIIEAYNNRYGGSGSTITAKQLKYVRLTYGSDPNFGAVLYNRVRRTQRSADQPQVQAPEVTETRQAGPAYFVPPGQEAVEPHGEGQHLQPGEGYSYPQMPGWEQFVRVVEHGENHNDGVSGDALPVADVAGPGGVSPRDGTIEEGEWASEPHDGCPLWGTHRHEPDGGIYFPSLATVLDTWHLMRLAGNDEASARLVVGGGPEASEGGVPSTGAALPALPLPAHWTPPPPEGYGAGNAFDFDADALDPSLLAELDDDLVFGPGGPPAAEPIWFQGPPNVDFEFDINIPVPEFDQWSPAAFEAAMPPAVPPHNEEE